MCLRCLGMKHDWTNGTKKRWSRLLVYAIVLLFLPRSLNILFRNLYFMNLILMTMKYTLRTEFVTVQVRGNNHWRTSQVRLKILNCRTPHQQQCLICVALVQYLGTGAGKRGNRSTNMRGRPTRDGPICRHHELETRSHTILAPLSIGRPIMLRHIASLIQLDGINTPLFRNFNYCSCKKTRLISFVPIPKLKL
jgi:hypothetical protein